MARAQGGRPVPVEGDRIGQSRARKIYLFVTCLVLTPIGGLAAWAWWTGMPTKSWLFLERIPFPVGVSAAATFLFGSLGLLAGGITLITRTELILGSDRLQIVMGGKHVSTQIPYENVARVEPCEDPIREFIGFKLVDPKAPGTVLLGGVSRLGKWHYRLTDQSWSVPLEDICDRLKAKIRKR
jgi:hypothetical protein